MAKHLECAHITVEFVDPMTPWPNDLVWVSEALQTRLPISIDEVDATKRSVYGMSLYQELLDASHSTPRVAASSSVQVTDFIDTVLSTVGMLRELDLLSGGDEPPVSIVVGLLRILGSNSSVNGWAIGGPPFLLPRSASAETLEENMFQGSSLLLVGALIDNREIGQTDGRAGLEGGSSDVPEEPNSELDSGPSQEHLTTLELSFDAHILAGRGYRTNCFLPALCVADETNINALVAAAAYQRYIWGLSLPVVGLCIYRIRDSVYARVVVGSIDGLPKGTHLPTVRLVMSSSLSSDPMRGVYDMTKPLDALLLSQFVLGLGSHIDHLFTAPLPTADCGLSWRADQIGVGLERTVTCCLQSANTAVGDVVVSDSEVTNIVDNVMLWVQGLPIAASSSQPTHSHTQATMSNVSSANKIPGPNSNLAPPAAPSEGKSARSEAASTIAKNQAKVDKWLALRGAVVCAVTEHSWSGKSKFQKRVSSMIPVYKSLVSNPPKWGDLLALIPEGVDPSAGPIRDKLKQQIQALIHNPDDGHVEDEELEDSSNDELEESSNDELDESSNDELDESQDLTQASTANVTDELQDDGKRQEIDKDGGKVIRSRFSSFCQVVSVAQQTHSQETITPEAGSRQPWDSLIRMTACQLDRTLQGDAPVGMSGDIYYERNIKMPPPNGWSPSKLGQVLDTQMNLADSQRSSIPGNAEFDKKSKFHALYHTLSHIKGNAHQLKSEIATVTETSRPKRAIADVFVACPVVLPPAASNPGNETAPLARRPLGIKVLHSTAGLYRRTLATGIVRPFSKAQPAPEEPDFGGEHVMYISTISGEYKSQHSQAKLRQAKNQSIFYMISMITYLEKWGLTGIPVFSVTAWGSQGTILMAWKDAVTGYIVIFRENTQSYDLTEPIEAFHFALVLHRLYHHQLEHFRKVNNEEGKNRLREKLREHWTETVAAALKEAEETPPVDLGDDEEQATPATERDDATEATEETEANVKATKGKGAEKMTPRIKEPTEARGGKRRGAQTKQPKTTSKKAGSKSQGSSRRGGV